MRVTFAFTLLFIFGGLSYMIILGVLGR